MKRILRSAASKNDANNVLPHVADTIPHTRRKATVIKENKENLTKPSKNNKNSRKKVVQPLRQNNSVAVDEKNVRTIKTPTRTAETESVASEMNKVTTANLKMRNIPKLNVTPPEEKINEQPKLFVSSSKNVSGQKQENLEETPLVTVRNFVIGKDLPIRGRSLRQKKLTAKEPVVVSPVRTRSRVKSSKASSVIVSKTSRQQKPPAPKKKSKESQVVSTPKPTEIKVKTARNAVERLQRDKKPPDHTPKEQMRPTVSDTARQIVTIGDTQKQIKSANDDKPKTKEPVNRNVTTRRKVKEIVTSDNSNEVKATGGYTRNRRSQSLQRAISKKKMDSNSRPTVDDTAQAFLTVRKTRNLEPKSANDDKPKTKEPVNRNVTTRRKVKEIVTSDNSNEVKATGGYTRNRRSQSLQRAISKKKMDSNSRPTVDDTAQAFLTVRKTRNLEPKSANDDKPKTKEPVNRNVTTRRKVKEIVTSDNSNEVKATGGYTRNRRSQSLQRAISKKKMDSNSRPTVDDTAQAFLTVRKTRNLEPKSANDDKPKTKEPVNRNVTTRRKVKKTVSSDNSNEVKAVGGYSRTRRSQSLPHAISEKEMDSNLKEKNVKTLATPARKRKAEKDEQKIDEKLTKQSELSANRSAASDQSNKSNVSVLPIYKRTSNNNNNIVDSIFDFESNSQENTATNDEQELVAKLVRENKAIVIKRKAKRKNGATKAKTNTMRTKKIEKLRLDLKELKEFQLKNKISVERAKTANIFKVTSLAAPKVTSKMNSETAQSSKTSQEEILSTDKLSDAKMLSLIGENVVDTEKLENQQRSEVDEEPIEMDFDDSVDHIDEIDAEPVEEPSNMHKTISSNKLFTDAKGTPYQQIQKTYAGPMKMGAFHHSTPVRIGPAGNASPWRVNEVQVEYSNNVFARYSELEKSPIKSYISNAVPEITSPIKKKQRKPLATQQLRDLLQKDEPKALKKDIQSYFGFADDDKDDDDNGSSLPAVNTSISVVPSRKVMSPKKGTSPKKANNVKQKTDSALPIASTFKMPQRILNIKEKLKAMRSAYETAASFDLSNEVKSKTQSKISTHFGDKKYGTASKPSSSQPSSSQPSSSQPSSSKSLWPLSSKPSSSKPSSSKENKIEGTVEIGTENITLFETNWLNREDQKHRSYSRGAKRYRQWPTEYRSGLTDDESEFGDTIVQKRAKRTKPKDDKHEQELKKYEEEMNSVFKEVDQFDLVTETSTILSV